MATQKLTDDELSSVLQQLKDGSVQAGKLRSEEHTSELQSHRDLHSFPTRRSSDLCLGIEWRHGNAEVDGRRAQLGVTATEGLERSGGKAAPRVSIPGFRACLRVHGYRGCLDRETKPSSRMAKRL